jgi:hypothetical protein
MRVLLSLGIAAAASSVVAQDIVDLPWRVTDKGELEVRQPAWDSVGKAEQQLGEWTPMFPGLFQPAATEGRAIQWVTKWGPMLAIPLLVHGDGGAAAIPEATRRMQKLGIPATLSRDTLRNLLRDPWRDLLHVQHLAATDVAIAAFALMDFADDEKASPFVRAAACDALLRGSTILPAQREVYAKQRVRRHGSATLHQGLALLPDRADLVIGVHGAALPSPAPLLSAWRRMTAMLASSHLLQSGPMSPDQETVAATVGDWPGQLPFELAQRVGNWRVDHALLALCTGDESGWWIHAGGLFQPERIAEGLRAGGFEVENATAAEVRAVVHGFVVRATASEFEAWSEDLAPGRRGSLVGDLRDRADAGAAPVWAFVPATSRFAAEAGFAETTLDVRFDPSSAKAAATATAPNHDDAARLLAAWRAWQGERRCEPDSKVGGDTTDTWGHAAALPPGLGEQYRTRLAWRRCMQAVHAGQEAATVRWSLNLTPFPLVDLVRFLGDSPATFLRDG